MEGFRQKGWAFGLAVLSLFGGVPKAAQGQATFYERYSYPGLTSCQQVRNYRAKTKYRTRELATLEYRYCVQNRSDYGSRRRYVDPILISIPPASASEDCIDATVLARLAIAHNPYGTASSEVAGFQQVLCNLPELYREENNTTLEWQNGRNAKFGNSWYYPNGRKAKFGSNWYYPNGKKATFGRSWYYPNGENARFGSSWYFPDGDRTNLTSLLSWSCGVLSYFDCQERLNELQTADGFWYDLAVVELSSRAYEEIYRYRSYDEYIYDDSDHDTDVDVDIDIIIK
ncbi:hypothetical protein Lepto7376_1468 [[Leptolyngbya] sp. PCC 7376]|uniref:hypothetical protein n=1 Tax=[Leptolyngbya] sp. PCC 7376 TaxID=111781 RepID=UPI00029EDB69|nr:hypothetical protein [[Leptolyngbya] sp. PCC 7376]AFY37811.1 hypothetical protein Lepto7376_1468 [[Leptolyngbya] sp. PCC 7376]